MGLMPGSKNNCMNCKHQMDDVVPIDHPCVECCKAPMTEFPCWEAKAYSLGYRVAFYLVFPVVFILLGLKQLIHRIRG